MPSRLRRYWGKFPNTLHRAFLERLGRGSILLLGAIVCLSGTLSTPPRVSSSLGSDHPRLFFSAGDLPTLQAQAATTHAEVWKPIKEYADTQLGTLPPALPHTEEDDTPFVNDGNQLVSLAFACAITEAANTCELVKNYLLTYAGWDRWGPGSLRDIALAHMIMGNALAYDWVFPYLTPEEQQTVRASLVKRTQELYEASSLPYHSTWSNWWTRAYLQNHYWINNSALGIAGLVLMGDETSVQTICTVTATQNVNLRAQPNMEAAIVQGLESGTEMTVNQEGITDAEGHIWWQVSGDGTWIRSDVVSPPTDCEGSTVDELARTWTRQAIERLSLGRDFLNGIKDGSWHESVMYQNYMLTLSLPFMVELRRLQGTDLLPHTYLQNYTAWRVYNNLPNSIESILAYGDFELSWSNAFAPQNLLRFVAHEYGDGYAEWAAQQLIAASGRAASLWSTPWYVFEFLYYDPSIKPHSPDDLAGSRVFSDLQGVIWRTGWGANSLIFGLKTSAYGGQFSYDTFIQRFYPWETPCQSTGCQLTIGHDHDDSNGFYLYNAGHWLAPETIGVDHTDTSFHNTILIDGQGQYRPESDFRSWEVFAGSDGFLEATASTLNFDYAAAQASRRYKNIEGIQDFTRYVLFVRPDYFLMFDHLAADAPHQYEWICHFGDSVTVEGNWIQGSAGDGALLGIATAAPQPFQTTTGNDGRPFVSVQPTAPVDEMHFTHLLYPTTEAAWNDRPTFTMLEDTNEITAVQVHLAGTDSQVDDVIIAYGSSLAPIRVDRYEFDGRAAVVSRSASGELKKVFVYGGTALSVVGIDNALLVGNLDRNEAFEIVYSGTSAAIYGHIVTEVMVYGPQIGQLSVNGIPWSYQRTGDYLILDKAAP